MTSLKTTFKNLVAIYSSNRSDEFLFITEILYIKPSPISKLDDFTCKCYSLNDKFRSIIPIGEKEFSIIKKGVISYSSRSELEEDYFIKEDFPEGIVEMLISEDRETKVLGFDLFKAHYKSISTRKHDKKG